MQSIIIIASFLAIGAGFVFDEIFGFLIRFYGLTPEFYANAN